MPRRLVLLAVGLALIAPATAHAASPDIVISQLYGGGGNSGATYTNDFVELENRGSAAVDVTGWSVQYASAAGTSWQATALSGSLAPGDRYLVQEGAGSGGTTPLPSPDATGSIAMSATNGKVALVTSAGALACGATCASQPGVKDFVGYGTANDFETAAAPGLSNTTAAIRGSGPDTDDNAADFTAGAPNPRDGGTAPTPPEVASSDPADEAVDVPVGSSIHVTFSRDVTIDPSGFTLSCDDEPVAATVTQDDPTHVTVDPDADLPAATACALRIATTATTPALARTAFVDFSTTGVTGLRIHDIQGAAHRSPYEGTIVSDVPGIVTGANGNGFWIQDPRPDRSDSTSEGVYVFDRDHRAHPAVGDAVTVSGKVQEFGTSPDLTTTEIAFGALHTSGAGSITPMIIGPGGRRPPQEVYEDDADGDVEAPNVLFDPREDGLDFDESLEGMLVQINHPDVVGPLANTFGELPVVERDSASPRTPRGGLLIRPDDFNPERMTLDDEIIKQSGGKMPASNVGDRLAGPVRAIVDYAFSQYMFEVTATPTRIDRLLQREVTQAPRANELAIASMNVENLGGDEFTPTSAKAERLAHIVVDNLRSPDILGVEEMQDDNGATDDGTVDASKTFEGFIAAIEAAGGPHYEYRQVDPVDKQDGGEPGGNIRVGFLFRTDRGVSFVDRPGGTSTVGTTEDRTKPGAQLTFSPGRIDPTNEAWEDSRKPLVGEFTWRGKKVFAIANHFNSKGGDQPLEGRFQPPERVSEVQRHKQATVLRDFVRSLLRADPLARIAVMGDFNDFDFSETLRIVRSGGLVNLMDTLPVRERYSYVFEGNSQVLDQILVSPRLLLPFPEYDSVHVNAEFADQASDHDPQVARVVP
jgi:predicted extracellular nuclease